MNDDVPFLRSPPFPGVDPSVAAISAPDGEGAAIEDAILAQVAAARVGGDYWGHRPQGLRRVAREGVAIPADLLKEVTPDQIGIVPGKGRETGPSQIGRILPLPCDPWAVVAQAQSVHADAEDDLAIVAGLLDVPVYGLDEARIAPERLKDMARRRIGAARYRDCFSGDRVDAAGAIGQLADWRRHIDGNRDIAAAAGMAFWKQDAMAAFLWDGLCAPPSLSADRALALARKTGGALAIWPSRVPPELPEAAQAAGVALARVEDGFLRSRGLGAALHAPGSVVVDRSGIYYDARRANDLETLLATHDFDADLIDRAQKLRARICATGVTKYGMEAGQAIALPPGRRTVLAIGQVEDDLSVRFGGAGVVGNLDLLRQVRRAEPDAWIIYRPHPDVQAGHRKGHVADRDVLAHADAIDSGAPLMALVEAVDAVHVLSSLTGFEALLRGKSVTTYGMPFYAGWGLTRDMAPPCPRRTRRLTVDQLVAAALILYPRYLDPVTQLPCSAELMVDRIGGAWTPRPSWLIRLRVVQGKLKRIVTRAAELLHG